MDSFEGTGGIDIAYERWPGDRDRPTVILHHGFAADTVANWVAPGVVEALSATGRDIVSIDARGHGRSAKPHDPAAYDSPAMADDVSRLIDHLDLAEVDLVGYSMGGFVSVEVACRESRLRSLVIGGIGDGALPGKRIGPPIDHEAVAAALEADDPAGGPAAGRGFRRLADATGADRLALAAVLRSDPHQAPALHSIRCPVLIIAGDSDPLTAGVDDLAEALPTARLVTLPGDHLGVVGHPEFVGSIVAFLAEVESPSQAG